MSRDPRPTSSLFTQVDISAGSPANQMVGDSSEHEQTRLLREMLASQDRQNELLEELVSQVSTAVAQFQAPQKQRVQELTQWKEANPKLARNCRIAAETLSQVQTEFLNTLTYEVTENAETLVDGEFMLNEFVDRFGPRLAHLNGVLQVLAQLSANTPAPSTTSNP